MKGCPSLPSSDYVRGNIRDRSLRDISLGRLSARKNAKRPAKLWGFCKTCRHAERCRGGCTWSSHVLFGRPGNNPMCHSRVLALAEAGIVEKLEPASAAPGKPFDFGHYRIVEAPLGPDLELDPVIGMTMASQAFGVSPGALSLWSKQELADCLGKRL